MHVLFLSDNFPPEVNAPASRTFEHCREWVRAGHQVTVITCAPNFPKGKVLEGYKNRLWQEERMSGIRVVRVWSYIARNEGFGRRIADYLSYMVSAFLASLFVRKVDIVVGTSPQFFTACAAYGCSVVRRKPWIFELRDLWPESIRAVAAMQDGPILRMLERLEMFLYRNASAIVSVTRSFKDNLVARGIENDKIHVITNGIDLDRFTAMERDSTLANGLGLTGKFVAGYIGTHGLAHGLDTLVDAAKILVDRGLGEEIHIVMLGDGAHRQRLRDKATLEQIRNIHFFETVSKEQVPRYWSLLDVSIVHLRKSELFKSVIPSKLFECMGMAIPVLHGVEGESAEIVDRHNFGLMFEPENPHHLAEQIELLYRNERLRKTLGSNGAFSAGAFDRKNLAAQMLDVLVTIASRKATTQKSP